MAVGVGSAPARGFSHRAGAPKPAEAGSPMLCCIRIRPPAPLTLPPLPQAEEGEQGVTDKPSAPPRARRWGDA